MVKKIEIEVRLTNKKKRNKVKARVLFYYGCVVSNESSLSSLNRVEASRKHGSKINPILKDNIIIHIYCRLFATTTTTNEKIENI